MDKRAKLYVPIDILIETCTNRMSESTMVSVTLRSAEGTILKKLRDVMLKNSDTLTVRGVTFVLDSDETLTVAIQHGELDEEVRP